MPAGAHDNFGWNDEHEFVELFEFRYKFQCYKDSRECATVRVLHLRYN